MQQGTQPALRGYQRPLSGYYHSVPILQVAKPRLGVPVTCPRPLPWQMVTPGPEFKSARPPGPIPQLVPGYCALRVRADKRNQGLESNPPSFLGCPRLHLGLGMCLTGCHQCWKQRRFRWRLPHPQGPPPATERVLANITRASLQPGHYQMPHYQNHLGHNTNEDT